MGARSSRPKSVGVAGRLDEVDRVLGDAAVDEHAVAAPCSAFRPSRSITWSGAGGRTAIRSRITISSAGDGWSMTIFIMKRSRWASGSW